MKPNRSQLRFIVTAIAFVSNSFSFIPTHAHPPGQKSDRENKLHPSTGASILHQASLDSSRSQRGQLAIREAKPTNESHHLQVHNLCAQTIELVIRYQAPHQEWVTQGWEQIPGKTSQQLTGTSDQSPGLSHKLMYYYARTSDSKLIWSGSGSHPYRFEQQTLNMRLHYAATNILKEYSLFILCNNNE